jgi:hypothetical protein
MAGSLRVDQDDQGVGVVAADIDDDGWPDIFTGNRNERPSNLYLNRGGDFEDVAVNAGITERGLGLGSPPSTSTTISTSTSTGPRGRRSPTPSTRIAERPPSKTLR